MNENRTDLVKSYSFDEVPHIMVVEARFYDEISDHLLKGACEELDNLGVTYEIFTVPGALEIPAAIHYAVRGLDFFTARRRFDAYVALGCVIRGETSHYDIVCNESARGIMDLSVRDTLAIGNGIITCENKEQALERARPDKKNKGGVAANAAVQMLKLKKHFGIYPRK